MQEVVTPSVSDASRNKISSPDAIWLRLPWPGFHCCLYFNCLKTEKVCSALLSVLAEALLNYNYMYFNLCSAFLLPLHIC